MASEQGAQQARRLLAALKNVYRYKPLASDWSALEHLLLGILADGAPETRAVAALRALESAFVDWNEVRVSSWCEIAEALSPMPRAMEKAEQIKAVLGRIFDEGNEMSLDFLQDKGQREVLRLIAGIEEFPESALARATLLGLGHAMMPLTPKVLAACTRIGLLRNGPDQKAIARRLERCIPRDRMYEFHWLVSRHTASVCLDDAPQCRRCRLQKDCRSGRTRSRRKRPTKVREKASEK